MLRLAWIHLQSFRFCTEIRVNDLRTFVKKGGYPFEEKIEINGLAPSLTVKTGQKPLFLVRVCYRHYALQPFYCPICVVATLATKVSSSFEPILPACSLRKPRQCRSAKAVRRRAGEREREREKIREGREMRKKKKEKEKEKEKEEKEISGPCVMPSFRAFSILLKIAFQP